MRECKTTKRRHYRYARAHERAGRRASRLGDHGGGNGGGGQGRCDHGRGHAAQQRSRDGTYQTPLFVFIFTSGVWRASERSEPKSPPSLSAHRLHPSKKQVSAREVKEKLKIAKTQYVQVGVWGGLVPENAHRPRALRGMIRAGALGFKAFMIDSGVDSFGRVDVDDLRAALPVIRDLNVPLLLHAELEVPPGKESSPPSTSYTAWLKARPAAMELRAVETVIDLLKELPQASKSRPNFRVHVVHASSAAAVDLVNRHRDLPITVETCPHYLLFASEDVPDGATEYKCAPAIRDRRNNDALVAAVRDGRVDGVASDHSPSPPSMKTGDFLDSWGGISGIQYTLPAVWESLVANDAKAGDGEEARPERWDRDIIAVHRALSDFPSRLLGIHHLKGRIADGYHADFVVWDPKAAYDAPCAQTQTLTPYASTTMRGRVLATVVRGKFVYDVAHHGLTSRNAAGVFACGNMAVSAAWLRPHPRPGA